MEMKPPIFMGCQSKSGASLLRTIIGRHPNIFGGDGFETHWFSKEIIGSWKNSDSKRQIWLRKWYDVSDVEYAEIKNQSVSGVDFFNRFMDFCTIRDEKSRWLEKTPDNLSHFELIRKTWPGVRFIHALREYKDIYASWKAKKLGSLKSLSVHDFAHKVRDSYRQIEHLLGKKTSYYFETKYEDLVQKPGEVIQKVTEFLGEPWIEGMENYQGDSMEFEKVREIIGKESNTSRSLKRPIFNDSVGQWQQILNAEEIDVIDTELGDLRERFGYA